MFLLQNRAALTENIWMDLLGVKLIELVLNSTKIQEFLSIKQHFDIVIMEVFLNDAFRGFCYRYNAHCIMLSTVGSNRWTNERMGNPYNPSYIPDMFVTYSSKMSFFERLFNGIVNLGANLFNHLYTLPKQNEILQKYFPGAPHILDLYYNVSLMLLNSDVSVNDPVPLVPNMIPVGGFHIDPPKELPRDLQEYLDSANNGAIYFSMGSNLQIVDMDKHKLNGILKIFQKLPQKILWKAENETLPETLTNVMVRSWFPQGDVLAHPNIKAFITHGGLLSTAETIYHGVPVICIPIFGDQEMNTASAVQAGYGLKLSYDELAEETLGAAITEILENPKYRKNAQKRSKIMHDVPIKPMDKAVFWVEYVLRHNGAPHLKTSALSLYWYQYLLLDVIAFATVVFLICVLFLYYISKIVIKKIMAGKSKKEKIN